VQKEQSLPYDKYDVKSIVEHAQKLVGSTLREHIHVDSIADPHRRKGSFGNALEEDYFLLAINSDPRPDFHEVDLELKSTPLKRVRGNELVAKERLVITMVSYPTVVNETFETSHLVKKASDMLLVSYLWEAGKDPLDYIVEYAGRWGLPEEDMPQFKADWETVVAKVRAGHAEDISSSDTLYLEACTKSADSSKRTPQPFSDVPAKPRAWALKASYMTAVSGKLLESMEPIRRAAEERGLDLLGLVRRRFEPYLGKTEEELAAAAGYTWPEGHAPKAITALVTKRILGVDERSRIAEFEKAGVKPKTIRLKGNGVPKEAVSFPAFDYVKLAETDFEDSDFYGYLQQRYLFVIYREGEDGRYRLSQVAFWQMPDADVEEARRCYEEMRKRVRDGRADESVKSTENRCCHVRPHGRDSRDTCMTPYGVPVVKKCFWLNQSYLAGEIDKLR
jgi:DNA mismatch repair protein MutH